MTRCVSQHDPLTGVYTRQYLGVAVRKLCVSSNLPISVIAADIDALDSVNELHGADVGDTLLVAASAILEAACGDRAIVARTGSDQFIAVVPKMAYDEAASACERVRKAVTHLAFGAMQASVTMGISSVLDAGAGIDCAIAEARTAMRRNKLSRGRGILSDLLAGLGRVLTERAHEAHVHSERIRQLALKVAGVIGMTRYDMDDLAILCELHDIGKIAIPSDILLKPGPLSDEEWGIMRTHPKIGYDIVRQIKYLNNVANGILTHHERWDGAGYPMGLQGCGIPAISRLLAIADAYDAMINDRPYRPALGHDQAVAELARGRGTQFDPGMTAAFIDIVGIAGDG